MRSEIHGDETGLVFSYNLKGRIPMSTYSYHEVLSYVQRLSPADQLRLLEDLASIIRQQVKVEPRHSVLEFEGIGQETWKDVDVEEYINQERNSWGG